MISNTTMATALFFCLTISGHSSWRHRATTPPPVPDSPLAHRSPQPPSFRDSPQPSSLPGSPQPSAFRNSSQPSAFRNSSQPSALPGSSQPSALPGSSQPSALRNSAQRSPSRDTTWHPLFNGKDLSGWTHVGPGSMSVDNGLLRGHGGMGLLYYNGHPFSNCTFKIIYQMKDTNDNSGVFIRIPVEPREEWMPVHYGYEVQIDNHPETSGEDDYHITGTLYSMTRPLAKPGRPGPEWNTMEITLDGPRTVVTVNGIKVTDYTEGAPVPPRKFDFEPFRGRRPDTGYFGIQNHSDKDIVFFKEISVRYAK